MHGFVEERFDMRPVRGGGVHGIHLGGDLFAQLPAGFFSHHINGCPARDLVQPGRQNGVGLQLAGVSREIGKNGLGDFLGQLRGADLPQRGGCLLYTSRPFWTRRWWASRMKCEGRL